MGNHLTQGAAIGGLGLLFDAEGNDRYTSHAFSIGFGGPLGVGAVIDITSDDYYQCGDKLPSTYNALDAPNSKPGDPLFQYDCFGLGTGAGQRILSKKPEWQAHGLAGGWGLLLDIEGQDQHESANFSQGHGYFFGAGVCWIWMATTPIRPPVMDKDRPHTMASPASSIATATTGIARPAPAIKMVGRPRTITWV